MIYFIWEIKLTFIYNPFGQSVYKRTDKEVASHNKYVNFKLRGVPNKYI